MYVAYNKVYMQCGQFSKRNSVCVTMLDPIACYNMLPYCHYHLHDPLRTHSNRAIVNKDNGNAIKLYKPNCTF